MSLSNPTEDRPKNPAEKFFFQWQGSQGYFYYYDKEAANVDPNKKGANVPLNIGPFIVLDQLSCIKGFNSKENTYVWSNEIRNTKTEPLEVSVGKNVKVKGLYQDVKATANGLGGDYTKSVYIAFKGADGVLRVGNIAMCGASLGAWIEFCDKNNVSTGAVNLTAIKPGKVGNVDFVSPVFSLIPIAEPTLQAAIALDRDVLQPFLNSYFESRVEEVAAPVQPVQQFAPPVQQFAAHVQQFQQPVQQFAQPTQQFTPPPSLSQPQAQQFAAPVQQFAAPVQEQVFNPNGNNPVPPGLEIQDDLPF